MGSSKKHKKHKSERRERYEEYSTEHRSSSLKLILKVGSNSTPEHGMDSPSSIYGGGSGGPPSAADAIAGQLPYEDDYPEKPKKLKKKKKKKDREKRHKHHKEKRHRRRSISGGDNAVGIIDDSSQEDISFGDDNSITLQESILNYSGVTTEHSLARRPVTKPMISRKIEEISLDSPSTSPVKSIQSSSEQISNLVPSLPSPDTESTPGTASTPGSVSTPGPSNTPKQLEAPKTPSSSSESGREPRTCVLKLKQSKTPLTKLLDYLLRCLEKRDPHQFFAWPVTDDIAPGYSSIITKPMDFSTMRQKIEDNEYSTLQEFIDDFRLMCENAIRYNHMETVYHKAAKRLLHLGGKILQPDHILRSLKPLPGYMKELGIKELGFDPLCHDHHLDNDHHILDSADEGTSGVDEPTPAQIEEEEKRKALRIKNEPKTRFEPYVDDLTPEEILAQVKNAAETAKKRLSAKKRAHQMGFLRQNKDGTTSLKILIENSNEGPEKVINLGAYIGKLQQGTGQLQGFREDRRNLAKIVKPVNYGAFSSYAPVYDSRFANLSKEETELVLRTYGDETGVEYADSLMEFTKDSSYASIIANRLLDVLTHGEHSKTMAVLYESQCQKMEQTEIEKTFPDKTTFLTNNNNEDDYEKYRDVMIDFSKLRTLSELGIDTKFLNEFEQDMKTWEWTQRLEDHLNLNLPIIEKLYNIQHERLSQPLPHHLGNIQPAGPEENQLAMTITSNLMDMVKKVTPGNIADPHALRKAMGISNVGLPPLQPPKLQIPPILQQEPCLTTTKSSNPIIVTPSSQSQSLVPVVSNQSSDTTQVPMDIETDIVTSSTHQIQSSVDLESELREFLENGSAALSGSNSADDNSIEQMLLN